jgi:hypothetical protein
MNILSLLLDVPPIGGGVGIFAVVALIFVGIAAAFFAFVMLRKTVKMAIRMIVVAVILLVAIVGSVSFLWFSSGDSSPRPRPSANRVK